MKMQITILFLLCLFLSSQTFSNDEPTLCPMDMSQFPQDTIPNYLQPWWNNIRIGKFALAFVDFPDGRWNDNGVLRQPFTNEQLALVPNKDAAGEVGVIKNINGQYEMKASKYSYYDRWNMFFDSPGV